MAFQLPRRFAAATVIAALALPALAQQPPAAGAAAPQGHHQAGERHQRHHGDHAQHRAQRLDALKARLHLTAAQEPAWTAFTTALQPGERPARPDRKEWAQFTTPERIDRMRALRTQHAAEADRRGEATKTFYAALTPEQQKAFDAQPQQRRGHPGHQHAHKGGAKPAAPAQ